MNTAFVTLVALLQCCIGNLNRICKVILSYYLGYVNHKSKINMWSYQVHWQSWQGKWCLMFYISFGMEDRLTLVFLDSELRILRIGAVTETRTSAWSTWKRPRGTRKGQYSPPVLSAVPQNYLTRMYGRLLLVLVRFQILPFCLSSSGVGQVGTRAKLFEKNKTNPNQFRHSYHEIWSMFRTSQHPKGLTYLKYFGQSTVV